MSIKVEQLNDVLGELDCGNFVEKVAAQLAETVMKTVHTEGKQKGEIIIKLSVAKIGTTDQVMISSRLEHKTPTPRGMKSEHDTTDTPMWVGKGGTLSINQPREDEHKQFGLVHEIDGKQANG